jgi:hypothetical protein
MPVPLRKRIEQARKQLDATCAEIAACLEAKRPIDRKLDALVAKEKRQRESLHALLVDHIAKGK